MQTNNNGCVMWDVGYAWDTCPLNRPRKVEGLLPRRHRFGPLEFSFGHEATPLPLPRRRAKYAFVCFRRALSHMRDGELRSPFRPGPAQRLPKALIPDE